MNRQEAIFVRGMQGLGDNFYQVPVIYRLLEEYQTVWLETSWPQIYMEHPNYDSNKLKFVKPNTTLRTQLKNIHRYEFIYEPAPNVPFLSLSYVMYPDIPIHSALLKSISKEDYYYYLELPHPETQIEPIVLIRPPTVRAEWVASARNCLPKYIQKAIDFYNEKGFTTVVVADIEEGLEWYDGFRPQRASLYYEKGEIDILSFCKKVSLIVGPVGFIVPLCIAYGIPNLIIGGGWGYYNNPCRLFVPGRGKINYISPKPLCMCTDANHNCNKTIDDSVLKEALECSGQMASLFLNTRQYDMI